MHSVHLTALLLDLNNKIRDWVFVNHTDHTQNFVKCICNIFLKNIWFGTFFFPQGEFSPNICPQSDLLQNASSSETGLWKCHTVRHTPWRMTPLFIIIKGLNLCATAGQLQICAFICMGMFVSESWFFGSSTSKFKREKVAVLSGQKCSFLVLMFCVQLYCNLSNCHDKTKVTPNIHL